MRELEALKLFKVIMIKDVNMWCISFYDNVEKYNEFRQEYRKLTDIEFEQLKLASKEMKGE